MCGIAGILQLDNSRIDEPVLERMCEVMHHRGPDDQGKYIDNNVALGMRRLSIIDLATGHQPLSNENGNIWIVFNGEIYNHSALRPQLIARGHRFRSLSDTEVIIHLYEEYGRECVQYLRGMFAFAIWDSNKRSLFIARDRLGIKPLYYHIGPQLFVFGSEIKVVLAHPSVERSFDHSGLPEYLAFGYLSGSATLYSGICKLMPGHWLEIDADGKLRVDKYWDLPAAAEQSPKENDYYVKGYRERLENAVRSHMMSDVPLGVFLSGGLDSSAVAALVARSSETPIETFSVGYAERRHSELPYARMVAQHLRSVHHECTVSEQEFFDALPTLIWHEDEPIVWPSSVPLYFIARLAHDYVKVVLTGEGSDETLAGYTRYAFTLRNAALDKVYRSVVPGMVRQRLREFISQSPLMHATLRRKFSHTLLAKDGASWATFYFENFFSAFTEEQQRGLFREETRHLFNENASFRHVLEYWNQSQGDMLHRMLYTDIKTYLVELLMKQDNMSMAASIESRVPFLDHELVEFALQIPQNRLLKGLEGKAVLKKAIEDLLPRSIVYRKKQGFPTPWHQWLEGTRLDSIQDTLLDEQSLMCDLFTPAAVRRLFDEHRASRYDHSDRIWRLLNLELWHRVCIEGDMGLANESATGKVASHKG